jgi:pyruvate dehydrogenase E2 component (dihydrolipoamide acetyltransferase)
MPVEVIMPKVDMDMATGKVAAWHVGVGERVEKGAPLFDIETDKAAMEVEAPASGILHHPAPEGTEVPIGAVVAWLYAEGEAVGAAPGAAPPAAAAPKASETAPPEVPAPATPPSGPGAPVAAGPRATPLARRLARAGGVDLASVTGSGPLGRIQGADIRSLLDARPAAAPPQGFTPQPGPLAVTRSRGGSGVPLVMIHGFASDALSWAPLEAELGGRSVIRIDLPSHGKSPRQRIASFAALVSEVRNAFDGLGVETAHLVGHSLGGAVALALADTRPRAVSGLSLIAPAGLGPEINGTALGGICRATRPESLGPWLKQLVADERLITDAYARLAMAVRADAGLRAAQQALAEVLFPDGVQAFDLRGALDRLEMPARIVWGRNDAIIPWRHALRAPGRVALHLFDGVGHMPQNEIAGDVAALVRAGP